MAATTQKRGPGFVALPPPRTDRQLTKQFQITARYHRFICREDQVTAEMRGRKQWAEGKYVMVQEPKGDKRGNSIDGMLGVYQLRVTAATSDTRTIFYRNYTCCCAACVKGDYTGCATRTPWSVVDLLSKKQQLDATQTPED
jgi:hypothetical protein